MASEKKPKTKVDAQKRSLGIQKKAKDAGALGKSNTRAGKSKGSTSARKLQNAGVADGTIRIGRGGKSYNVYDAKSGTWKRGKVVKASTPKPKGGEPPNRSQKAAQGESGSKDMRMGYQYPTVYGKPATSYTNQGASVVKTPGGQPKAIRPSGGPVRYARFSGKKK